MKEKNKLMLFQGQRIRKEWYNDEWWFSVVDIVAVLTDSEKPRDYWYRLKEREKEASGIELSTNCRRLKLRAEDGKMRETDCANTGTAFRIIQSIPSKNAEPMKLWLAKVGYERVQEIENPELAMGRAKDYYRLKGYPEEWMEKRLRGIAIRKELTDEWDKRGIEEKRDFAILTDEINKSTFDVSVKEHKRVKNLNPKFKNQNLRDHMTDLELIFNMLGEKVTTEITRKDDAEGFNECKGAAKRGGRVARNARLETEKEIGRKVVSKDNAMQLTGKKKKMLKGK